MPLSPDSIRSCLEQGLGDPGDSLAGSGAPASELELSIVPRIINGTDAHPGSWPWHVVLLTPSGLLLGGGSLISKNWVITAAHCNVTTSDWVMTGLYDRSALKDQVLQKLRIAQIFRHPTFYFPTLFSDIALLKLEEAAHFHQMVSPVLLPSADDQFLPGTLCTVMGWGKTQPDATKFPEKLQQADLPLLSTATCKKYWHRISTFATICAGLKGGCSYTGDSGGPMVCPKNGTWVLVGIVSCASRTCPTKKPLVATRVTTFIPWIEDILAHN
ncbi:chymotrypsinogen B-like [Talpa occidentalis]|uniref:chymotrypsinogen B-like n=1 Tax=Talpa occidentalis TaxID=50954 RepID=UPI00188E5FC2|nr:chymotrypsinogen B-like [Talpa occidentalis]